MKTCQQIFDAALLESVANDAGLYTNAATEILRRINYGQQDLFTRLAEENRYFYARVAQLASSNAASGRVVDLATLVPPLERVLITQLPLGTPVNVVDLQDLAAELAPRAYPIGTTLAEVGSEWSAVAGPVTLMIGYVYRPAELDLTQADLAQQVTVPDRFCSYLEYDLAWYIGHKDFGRGVGDPKELERVSGKKEEAFNSFVTSLDHFAGLQAQRFILPKPARGSKQ